MAQYSTSTGYNRYPAIFRTVKAHISAKYGANFNGAALKVLSFGCSNGAEVMTLRCYFPDAAIFGCDVDVDTMRIARKAIDDPNSHLFESSPAAIAAFAPYHVIFAMSVLCRWGLSRSASRLDEIYPFASFQHSLATLHESLADGGLLCLYNANYLFSDTEIAAEYHPVRSQLISSNGFVDKWHPSGARLTRSIKHSVGTEHILSPLGQSRTDPEFRDCIFEKGAREPIDLRLGADQPDGSDAAVIHSAYSGPDLHATCSGRRLVSGLKSDVVRLKDGATWVRQEWLRSGVNGEPICLGPYWGRAAVHEIDGWNATQVAALEGLQKQIAARSSPIGRIKRGIRHQWARALAKWR